MELDLSAMLNISAHGMRAQTGRMRVLAENVANANTTGDTPGADPYRRQIPVFENVLNRELGIKVVTNARPIADMSDFAMRFDPSHPAANAEGYVKTPNVRSIMEATDLREAQRSYEANLAVIDSTRQMIGRTIDLLRG